MGITGRKLLIDGSVVIAAAAGILTPVLTQEGRDQENRVRALFPARGKHT